MVRFSSRVDAGKKLAHHLSQFKNKPNTIVLGLPRGGVVVAAQVAQELGLPLDIVVTRKIGAPMEPELAVGAITEQGVPVWNDHIKHMLGIELADVASTIDKERHEIKRRLALYRGTQEPLNLTDKTVIIIDDGIATGATMRAAIADARLKGAKKVVVAVPLSAPDALIIVSRDADEMICLNAAELFPAIGFFYDQFPQVTDEEVVAELASGKK